MKSIEEYIHDRLKELQVKKENMRRELDSIEVRVEELNNIILKIANEPAEVDDEMGEDVAEENDYMEEAVPVPPPPVAKAKKPAPKIEEEEEDPMAAAMRDLEAANEANLLDGELAMLGEDEDK